MAVYLQDGALCSATLRKLRAKHAVFCGDAGDDEDPEIVGWLAAQMDWAIWDPVQGPRLC